MGKQTLSSEEVEKERPSTCLPYVSASIKSELKYIHIFNLILISVKKQNSVIQKYLDRSMLRDGCEIIHICRKEYIHNMGFLNTIFLNTTVGLQRA